MSVFVPVTCFEWSTARRVGEERHFQNIGKSDRRSYKKNSLQASNMDANTDAALCEIAVAKAYGVNGGLTVWDKTDHLLYCEEPDLKGRIKKNGVAKSRGLEVKRRRTADVVPFDFKDAEAGRLIVWAQVHGDNLDSPVPVVEIIGEIEATWDLWETTEEYNNDFKRHKIPRQMLREPDVLEEYFEKNTA